MQQSKRFVCRETACQQGSCEQRINNHAPQEVQQQHSKVALPRLRLRAAAAAVAAAPPLVTLLLLLLLARVSRLVQLQECHNHDNECVAAHTSCVDFVQFTLGQEHLWMRGGVRS